MKKLVVLFVVVILWGYANFADAALPEGFSKETLVSSGLSAPTTLRFAPDGRLFILEWAGKVKIFKNGSLLNTPFAEVPALANSDRGALGLVFDPDWNVNHYLYVYYVDKIDKQHTIWRFSGARDIADDAGVLIFKSGVVPGPNHAGGGLAFGPDGMLYLSIGDGNSAHLAQDKTSVLGKMLRMNKDGSVPSDNPFKGQGGMSDFVWAYGFRNPFRITFDKLTGRGFVADVGESTWEEVDVLDKGKNYGWPKAEGKCTSNCTGLTDPVYVYKHTTVNGFNTGSIIGGFVYRGNAFPTDFNGSYFYADFSQQHIDRLIFEQRKTNVLQNQQIESSIDTITDLVEGPDEAVYYVTFSPSKLYRLSYMKSPVEIGEVNKQEILNSGLSIPTTFGFSPDGRLFIEEMLGAIKIFQNGQLQSEPFVKIPTFGGAKAKGMYGLAFDPDWENSPYVYAYFIGPDDEHTVVRMKDEGGKAGPVETIYKSGHSSVDLHFGGGMAFGPDGKLYFSIGDGSNASWAQDLSLPYGKVLRINKDGSIPTDNPFQGAGQDKHVWALGFRNPFRLQFDSETGKMYLADVGQGSWEEVDVVEKGKNYGWPKAEGKCLLNCAGLADPIYAYPHNDVGSSITGGFIYRGNMFPQEHRGSYFFGDYTRGWLRRLDLHDHGSFVDVHGELSFDLQAPSPADMTVGPDGSIYYLDLSHRIVRYTFGSLDLPPTAIASANVTSGGQPLKVKFSSFGSIDPEGKKLSFEWDFGDGSKSSSSSPEHIYNNKGQYTVKLTVSDGVNVANATPIVIQVSAPPVLTIVNPADGVLFNAGDVITYEFKAKDNLGKDLPDTAFSTEIRFQHNTHYHPFIGPITSRTGSFVTATTGESADDIWYRIIATAEGSSGLTTTKQIDVLPRKSNNKIITDPPGLVINVDDQPKNTDFDYLGVVGFVRTLEAPEQVKNGKTYIFDSWSDGGAARHEVVTISGGATYLAKFKEKVSSGGEEVGFLGEYYANKSLSGTPLFTRLDKEIKFQWHQFGPGGGLPDDGFSIRWTRKRHFDAGSYKFTAVVDDGVRLYIDEKLVIESWVDQVATLTAVVDLGEGDHEIRMEYFEDGGHAQANLAWEQVRSASKTWHAEYFGNKDLVGQVVKADDVSQINYLWNASAPYPEVPKDLFSARFTKTIASEAGLKKFKVTADDGVRVFVDGKLVLDKWRDQAMTTFPVEVNLSSGLHEVKIEYYEAYGGAILVVEGIQ